MIADSEDRAGYAIEQVPRYARAATVSKLAVRDITRTHENHRFLIRRILSASGRVLNLAWEYSCSRTGKTACQYQRAGDCEVPSHLSNYGALRPRRYFIPK